MPRGGARPGAGRPRKGVGSPTLAKEARAHVAKVRAAGKKLAIEVLSEAMNFFYGLAAYYQPNPTNLKANEQLFHTYMDKAGNLAAKLAPYESPRLSAISVAHTPMDLSELDDQELADLERLVTKAANSAGLNIDGAGGTPATLN